MRAKGLRFFAVNTPFWLYLFTDFSLALLNIVSIDGVWKAFSLAGIGLKSLPVGRYPLRVTSACMPAKRFRIANAYSRAMCLFLKHAQSIAISVELRE
ncbi:hypothetical protein [Burkholderia sp. LMG 32019]|uniref:hypothetical protein n=1 Tax=Burkholderia sp. LMG 32019 TaxID=3158173 RepID=UPI003C2DDFC7